ncbi:MAG: hypothetical protein ACR2FG_05785 [Marmoricola sp.]
MTDLQAIPEGSRLVHIGFPKTGTTSIQDALRLARPHLAEHGVTYPGKKRNHRAAALYISGAAGLKWDPPTKDRDWKTLVRQVNRSDAERVAISSEWMAETSSDGIRRLVEEFGGDNVHIVATLRPIVKILPSAWQQFLQNGHTFTWDQWLRGMLLDKPYDKPTPSFWRRHQHDEILARWAEIAGPDHVTAIVVDSRDHQMLLRQFETMLALPEGFLVPEPPAKDNRSLTWPEAEMVRWVNAFFAEREWPDSLYRSVVRRGIVSDLAGLRPDAGSLAKIPMPEWAAERATEIGQAIAENIAGLGINVVGDLDSLGEMPATFDATSEPAAMVPATIAASALIAAISAGLEAGEIEGRAAAQALREEALREEAPAASAAQKMPPAVRRVLLKARRRTRGY